MTDRRIQIFKAILWILTGMGAAVAMVRFSLGLGVATALSNTTPWGLWIGFDVMGGVALAAGGFVVAAIVHIFHREKYHPASRPAILTAFLGYAAVAVGLLFDLGLPWHIWHPVIFWNVHSALFEVAWCVMLYLTVLALEVSPLFFERTAFQGIYRFLKRLTLPIMILGIMLSTLHQSSLGSLMLIMPSRLHPLWYTPLLPELFFVSAVCLGLTMVMFESSITSWLYRRKPETEMLAGLAVMAAIGLSAYFIFRIADLVVHGKAVLLLQDTWERNLFIAEMLMSSLLPILLFSIRKVRCSATGIWIGSSLSVLGFVLNRVNASGLGQVWATRDFYFPSWMEFAISLGLVSAFALVFFFIQEHFPVDPEALARIEKSRDAALRETPRFPAFTQVYLGQGWRKNAKVFSLLFILAVSAGITMTPKHQPAVEISARRARGGDILRVGSSDHFVYFDHKKHQDRVRASGSCAACHHLHKAGDVGTPCSECHRELYTVTNIFDHSAHVTALHGNASCSQCHLDTHGTLLAGAKTCQDCHRKDMMTPNPTVKSFVKASASSYQQALHGMCITCHTRHANDPEVHRPDLARCGTCHNEGTATEKAYRLAQNLIPEGNDHGSR
jgi:Ni/Fe-hydrogenase subunit HybB-like protein